MTGSGVPHEPPSLLNPRVPLDLHGIAVEVGCAVAPDREHVRIQFLNGTIEQGGHSNETAFFKIGFTKVESHPGDVACANGVLPDDFRLG